MALVECVGGKKTKKGECAFNGSCVTQAVWEEAGAKLDEYFATITIKTLCDRAQALGIKREQDHRFVYYI